MECVVMIDSGIVMAVIASENETHSFLSLLRNWECLWKLILYNYKKLNCR